MIAVKEFLYTRKNTFCCVDLCACACRRSFLEHRHNFGFNGTFNGRHKQLESILVVTQKFHETLEPLSDWLLATEKHLANSEPIGTESSKLEKQIAQQKVADTCLSINGVFTLRLICFPGCFCIF